MKKSLVLILVFIGLASASIRLQGQADVVGTGVGIGLGQQIVPMFLEVGAEGSVHGLPQFSSAGSYEGVPYDGKLGLSMTRVGGFLKFSFPVADMLPIVGMFFHPIVHFGSQNGTISVDGSVRPVNNGIPINESIPVKGSYVLVGFPSYLGPLFIEPAIGSQHIFIPGYGNYKNTLDAQIALGLSI